MSSWTKKRFWQQAAAIQTLDGYTVQLDGKPIRTPAKAAFIMPKMALAEAVAEEWQAQEDTVEPDRMPLTRTVNSALDKVGPAHDTVAGLIADYGTSDLICYRAEAPQGLIDRQAEVWDPLVIYAQNVYQAPLNISSGLMPVLQPSGSLARLRQRVQKMSNFELAALHDLVALSGSLIIGLAATDKFYTIERLWAASRIDESWQAEHWGEDVGANAEAELKRDAFYCAKQFFDFCS
jgi:chaperone required for assembly of F1-ATPase